MNDKSEIKVKSKWNKRSLKYYLQAKGNVPKAMALYIANEGCQGIVCKECFLNISCDKNPDTGRVIAIKALEEAEKIEKSKAEAKTSSQASQSTSQSNT